MKYGGLAASPEEKLKFFTGMSGKLQLGDLSSSANVSN